MNAETGIRGYAATRDPLFLAPYNLTLTRIGAERRSLREAAVIEGDGRQQQAVDATTGKVLSELAQLRSAIGRGISAGNLRQALENEKTTMDLLRRQVADLANGPTALVAVQHNKLTALQTRIERARHRRARAGAAGRAGRRRPVHLGHRQPGRRNAENARRLGEGQPLQPITYAGDEIGRVAELHLVAEALLARRDCGADGGQG